MAKKSTYALLIYRPGPGEPAPAEVQRALKGHRALQRQAAARGELHAVARLDAADDAKTVRMNGGAHDVSDGPYIEAKEWLVGFYLLDCASQDEAIERARMLCPIEGHVIEVRPVGWRWKD